VSLSIKGSFKLEISSDHEKPRVLIKATCDGFAAEGEGYMAYTLPNDKTVAIEVTYLDAHGNTVDLPQGNVSWTTSDAAILTVTADAANDQHAELAAVGPVGNAQVNCTGANPDGSQVIALMDVTVVAGNAVTGTITPVPPA